MNREMIYDAWRKMNYGGNAFCSKSMVDDFRRISDRNFQYYVRYQEYMFAIGQPVTSIKSRRSKLVSFLIEISDCALENITQPIVDAYFQKFESEEPQTTNTRVDYLKGFLEYLSLGDKIDFEKYKKPIDRKADKKMKRMSAEQISMARDILRTDIRKRFVFDMMYYTSLSMEEIGKLRIGNVDFINRKIRFGKKENDVPKALVDLIHGMQLSGEFEKTYDIMTTIEQMRKELSQYGLDNLKSTDGKETRKATFWKCPQCGCEYEAIAENWCVKQYTDGGENWVVCREKCGNG